VLFVRLVVLVCQLVLRHLYCDVPSHLSREVVCLTLWLRWLLVRVVVVLGSSSLLGLIRVLRLLLVGVALLLSRLVGALLASGHADILHFVNIVPVLDLFLRQIVLLGVVVARACTLYFA
jgi:hypothetical protein